MGLGLTIAKGIVDDHGGRLELTSDGPGLGGLRTQHDSGSHRVFRAGLRFAHVDPVDLRGHWRRGVWGHVCLHVPAPQIQGSRGRPVYAQHQGRDHLDHHSDPDSGRNN